MRSKIKILILEDNPSDIDLIYHEFKKSGIIYESEVAQNEKGFRNVLKEFIPDIILSDYSLPSFNGPTALEITEKVQPGTPFIIVSGNIGEEKVAELIKNGITDYVLKDQLFALPAKIIRALKEAEEKKEKRLPMKS